MPKHLTPAVHPSWLHRDDYTEFEFPARPESPSLSGDSSSLNGACGESSTEDAYKHIRYEYCDIDCACQSSTGTGEHPHSLSLTPLAQGEPVPVGHLSLIERIKEAAK
jgi:hypothetical protein